MVWRLSGHLVRTERRHQWSGLHARLTTAELSHVGERMVAISTRRGAGDDGETNEETARCFEVGNRPVIAPFVVVARQRWLHLIDATTGAEVWDTINPTDKRVLSDGAAYRLDTDAIYVTWSCGGG